MNSKVLVIGGVTAIIAVGVFLAWLMFDAAHRQGTVSGVDSEHVDKRLPARPRGH
ncbi:MAG TPA: hypothetical protein VGF99_21695 [Myxococcota bacterium]